MELCNQVDYAFHVMASPLNIFWEGEISDEEAESGEDTSSKAERGKTTTCEGETTNGTVSVSKPAPLWLMSEPAHNMAAFTELANNMTASPEPPVLMAAMP